MKKIKQFFRGLYLLFTADLTKEDIQRLFSDELRGMYDFYVRNMQSVEGEKNSLMRGLTFCWYLFVAFLQRLTPARRLLYAIAFGLFVMSPSGQFNVQIFIILNLLLALEMSDKLVTRDELEVARDIQVNLVPRELQIDGPFAVAAYSEAARNVGGDYYDCIRLTDGSSLVVIADVSGKGISAALYMVKVQTALRLFARDTCDPKQLLVRLNEHLHGQMKRNYFLTILLVQVQPDGTARVCRAGHPPALWVRCATHDSVWIQPRGVAIGMVTGGMNGGGALFEDEYAKTVEAESLRLGEGDVLLLYTDGVIETANRNLEEFGAKRFDALARAFATETPERVRDRIVAGLQEFRAGAELRDDTTLLIIKRVPSA